jgi:hypothetical protein
LFSFNLAKCPLSKSIPLQSSITSSVFHLSAAGAVGAGLMLGRKFLFDGIAEIARFCMLKKLNVGARSSILAYFIIDLDITLFFYAGGRTTQPRRVSK